jgi:hypothetical protein
VAIAAALIAKGTVALGWIITSALTALACWSIDHLLRWEKHRQRMLKVVTNPMVWQVDCLLLAMGFGFASLAMLIY